MEIKKNSDENIIFSILNSLKDSFFSDSVKNEVFISDISKKFSKFAEFYYVGELDTPKGFIAFYDNNKTTKEAFLSMIIVAKECQGQGIGKRLLNIMIETCISNGMKSIVLEVARDNENAISFYERFGFIKTDRETDDSYYYSLKI